uniref:Ig-like domain-containing protein n=1 Tax=Lonepinella koalarum TaxID=53417 RepID=UPI003F6E0770
VLNVAQNVANQAVTVQHKGANTIYELVDPATNYAPQTIVTERVGNDLHIIFEDSQDVDLIIENYYDDPSLIHGLAEDGHYYAYMPANGEAASAINVLNESMLATEVLGGEQLVLPWLPYWLGSTTGATVGAIVGGIALVGGGIALATSDGSSGSSSTPAPQPDPQPEPTPTNTDPVANDDTANTAYGTALNNINVLSNDSDADGDNLSVSAVSLTNPSQGTVSVNPDGTINFTPAEGVTGDVLINYTVSDGKGGTDTATLTVTVGAAPIPTPPAPNNTDPVANDDTASTEYGTALNNINVLSNDSDADGDNLSVSAVSLTNPSQGTVSVNPDGTINFTPAEGVTGDVVINYTVSDGKGGTDTATLTVTVGAAPIPTPPAPNNTDPVANDDTASTEYGTALNNINVLSNDSDADGDNLSVSAVSLTNPSQGTVSVNPDGTINFTPADGVTGDVVINYTVSDGKGGTDTATLTVSVGAAPIPTPPAPNNTDPVANDDTANTAYGTALNNINVLSNDSDADGDNLSVSAVSLTNPNQGTVSVNPDGTINFTPAEGVTGDVVINYTVSDGKGGTDTATLTVSVGAAPVTPPSNNAPVANDDTASTQAGTPVTIDVLDNDTDPDNNSLTIIGTPSVTSGQGTVAIVDNKLVFTPAEGFNGSATISYEISDGNGGTDTATVTVTVNGKPVANDDTASTQAGQAVTVNVLTNDSDPDGDQLTVSEATLADPSQGTLVKNSDGTLTFTPAAGVTGDVVINYTISDGNGGTDSSTVTVNVNGKPVANDDSASAQAGQPVTIDVVANDSDPDNNPLTVSEATLSTADAGKGSVSIVDNKVVFTPNAGVTGDVVINYTISDGKGGTDTATVTVTVSVPLPPAPTATPYHDNGSDPTDPTDDIIGVIVTFPDDLSNVDSLTLSYTNNNGIDKSEYTLTKNPTTGEWELPQAAKDAGLTLGTDDQDNPTVIVPIEQLIHGQTVTAYTSNDSGNSDNATGKPYITDYKDPLDLNRKNIYGKDVDERIQADDPTNPTDDEKADAIATLKLANATDAEVKAALNNSEHPPEWNDTDKTLKITYADGSSDVIPYAELFSTEPPYVTPPEIRAINTGDMRIYFPESKVSVKLWYTDESGNEQALLLKNNEDGTWSAYYYQEDAQSKPVYGDPVPQSILQTTDGDYATLNRYAVKDGEKVYAYSYNEAGDTSSTVEETALPNMDTYDPTTPGQTITPPDTLVDFTPDTIDDLFAVWYAAGMNSHDKGVSMYSTSEQNASIPTENGDEYTNLARIELNGGVDETTTFVIPGNMQASDDTNVAVKVIGETALVIGGGIYGTTYTAESGVTDLIDFSYGLSRNTTGGSSIARTGVELSGGADLLWVGGSNANYDLYYNASTGYTLVKAGETPPANAGTKVESSSTSSTGGTIRHAEILMDGIMNTDLDQETEAINGDDTLIVSGISDTTAAQARTNAAIYNSLIILGSGNDTVITTGGTGQTDYSGMILESTIGLVSVNGTYPQETTYWIEADEIPYTYLGDNTIITTGLQNSVVDLRGYKDEDWDYVYEINPATVNDDTLSIEYGTNNGLYSSTGNQIHMGYGMDTLEFTGNGQEYDLNKLSSTPMSVETISITGSNNTVVVSLSDLVDTGTGEILIDTEIGQAGRYVMRIGDTSDGDAGNQLKLDSDFAYTGYVEVSNNNQEYYVYQSQTYSDLFVFVDKDLAVI